MKEKVNFMGKKKTNEQLFGFKNEYDFLEPAIHLSRVSVKLLTQSKFP